MSRIQLASLGAGVAQSPDGVIAAGVRGTIYFHDGSGPVPVYPTELGGSADTSGGYVTDQLGRIPGWIDSFAASQAIDIAIPPAAPVTVMIGAGPPGVGANWKGIYAGGTTYALGDGVTGSDGHQYISLIAGNVGHDPTTDGGVRWSDLIPVAVSKSTASVTYLGAASGTDDTSAIQAALTAATAGSIVRAQHAQQYKINSQLVPNSRTVLDLNGSTINLTGAFTSAGKMFLLDSKTKFKIRNGSINCAGTGDVSVFSVNSASGCVAVDLDIALSTGTVGKYAALCGGVNPDKLRFLDCVIDGTGTGNTVGFAPYGGIKCTVRGCTFINVLNSINPAAFTIAPNLNWRIIDNTIIGDKGIGIQDYCVNDGSNSQATLIRGNIIDSPVSQGISCTGMGAQILGNQIIDGRGWAIEANAVGTMVAHNHIEYSTAATDTGIIANSDFAEVTLTTSGGATINQTPATLTVASNTGVLAGGGQLVFGANVLNYTGIGGGTTITGVTVPSGTVSVPDASIVYFDPSVNGGIVSANTIIRAGKGVQSFGSTVPVIVDGNNIFEPTSFGILGGPQYTITGNVIVISTPFPLAASGNRFAIQTGSYNIVKHNKIRYGAHSYTNGSCFDLPFYLTGGNNSLIDNAVDFGGRSDATIFCSGVGATTANWTVRGNRFFNGGAGIGYHATFNNVAGLIVEENIGTINATGGPAATAGAGMGTSPPANPAAGSWPSTDRYGGFSFGSGTTPASGVLFTVVFSRAFDRQPTVILTEQNAATKGLSLFVSASSTTGFTVSSVNAPVASQSAATYVLGYSVRST